MDSMINCKRLDVDLLHSISYERSKNWAQLFVKYSTNNSAVEYPLKDLNKFLPDECSEDEAEDDCEIAATNSTEEIDLFDGTDVLRDSPQHEQSSKNKFDFCGTTILSVAGDDNESFQKYGDDLQDVLNETVPMLMEHKRKLKEAGMERILNTFDTHKIEEEVGEWLRRNQSRIDEEPFQCAIKSERSGLSTIISVSDSDSSLHSIETARYVLMNMKKKTIRSAQGSASSIKSYRTVQSKRDALREKYACEEMPDCSDEKQPHERNCRGRRRLKKEVCQQQAYEPMEGRSSACRSSRYRRKLLRKRRWTGRSCSGEQSSCSSTEGYDVEQAMQPLPACKEHATPSECRQRFNEHYRCRSLGYTRKLHHRRNQQHSLSSSSSVCAHSGGAAARPLSCCGKLCVATLPRESECRCRNDRQLCDDVKHLADTSTEEWMVENIGPRSGRSTTTKKSGKSKRIKGIKSEFANKPFNDQPDSCIQDKERARKAKPFADKKNEKPSEGDMYEKLQDGQILPKLRSAAATRRKAQKIVVAKNTQPNQAKTKKKKTQAEKITGDETFNRDLEQAVKESLEMLTQNLNNQLSENTDKESETVNRISVEGTAVVNSPSNICPPVENIVIPIMDEESILTEVNLRPQPKSAKLRKLAKIAQQVASSSADHTADATFFRLARHICNSTAVPNDLASVKQMRLSNESNLNNETPKSRRGSQAGAVAGLTQSRAASADSGCQFTPRVNRELALREQDCSVVSSTTCGDRANNTIYNNNEKSSRDILVYTPDRRKSRCSDANSVQVTELTLRSAIGTKAAMKFCKYYIGQRCFDANASIYYRPPAEGLPALDASHDSDLDELELMDQCGSLYATTDKKPL